MADVRFVEATRVYPGTDVPAVDALNLRPEGVYVDFGGNDRYGYKGLTLEEFRGQHLRRYYNRFTDAHCIARGRTHAIAFVDVSNHASIRSTTGMGNRRIGFAGYLKRGPLFIPFRTTAVRRRGFRFFVPRVG